MATRTRSCPARRPVRPRCSVPTKEGSGLLPQACSPGEARSRRRPRRAQRHPTGRSMRDYLELIRQAPPTSNTVTSAPTWPDGFCLSLSAPEPRERPALDGGSRLAPPRVQAKRNVSAPGDSSQPRSAAVPVAAVDGAERVPGKEASRRSSSRSASRPRARTALPEPRFEGLEGVPEEPWPRHGPTPRGLG